MQQEAQRIEQQWKEQNSDIADLWPLLSRDVASDPRAAKSKNFADLAPILPGLMSEHTERYRKLVSKYVDLGREEERQKLAGISPSAPQSSTQQPPPSRETPASSLDPVDEFIAERQKRAMAQRGQGFARDDYRTG
jgi:hypothetical protein